MGVAGEERSDRLLIEDDDVEASECFSESLVDGDFIVLKIIK